MCRTYAIPFLCLLFLLTAALPVSAGESTALIHGWLFQKGPVAGAEAPDFDDSGWRSLSLPHDWSIEGKTFAEAGSEGGGGFFPTGEGWYRRSFEAPREWSDKQVTLHFEGAYRNAEVWLNGERLGSHAYGYTPFRFDLSDYLKPGGENLIAVHIRNEPQPNSRWYTGSGLYRPVWLEVENSLHIAPGDLTYNTRELSDKQALVEARANIRNQGSGSAEARLEAVLRDPDGRSVARTEATLSISAGEQEAHAFRMEIENPRQWSPETPHLYTLELTLANGDAISDTESLPVGLRTVAISAAEGFLLNGEPVELYGGNVHHDTGPLGAAAYPAAEERKVRLLKEAGFNAVRTAHNPPSTAFLEACDRLGLLVIDEIFDSWKAKKLPHDYGEIFDENWEADLRSFIRRDRNHPSVVIWSVGNEVYERGNAQGIRRAHDLAAVTRQEDRTRPVTIGLNGLGETGDWRQLDPVFAAFETVGYNYELAARHADDHQRHPNRVIYASESYQYEAFENWQIMHEQPYVIGDFVWTALDYLGEAGIGRVFPPHEEPRAHWEGSHFPWHGAYTGDIDLIGFRKPISYYRQIIWDRGADLHAAVLEPAPAGDEWNPSQWAIEPFVSSWTWPGHEDEKLTVEVYSRHDAVRLSLNGRVVGEAETGLQQAFKASFEVPYNPGTLLAEGLRDGEPVETFVLETAGTPTHLALLPESGKLTANGLDLAFVVVEVQDANGRLNPTASPSIRYTVEGPGEIMAIGSGDLTSRETYQQNPRHAADGRALVVIRSTGEGGEIRLSAQADGLEQASIRLSTQPAN